MSTSAHKGQILALKNQLTPILPSTVLYADYRNDLYAYNQGERILPFGYKSALQFDGSTFISPIALSSMTGLTAFTVEFWVNPATSANFSTVFGAANQDYAILIEVGGKISMRIPSLSTDLKSSNTALNFNQWNHVACTYNGSDMKIYINRYLDKTWTIGAGTVNYGNFAIGKAWATASRVLSGALTEFRIWNYARTDEQIFSYAQKELKGDDLGLLAYWKMNESEGSIVRDSSPYGNDYSISGTVAWVNGRVLANLATYEPAGGVVVEEGTTNLCKSDGYTSWTISNGWTNSPAVWSRTPNAGLAPDGTMTATRYTITGGADGFARYTVATSGNTLGVPYTGSLWLKGTGALKINLAEFNGAVGAQDTGYSPQFILDPNKWQRFTFTSTIKQNDRTQLEFRFRGTGDLDFYVWGCQYEQKWFPTSLTNTTRSTSRLTYPIKVDVNNMTLNFWAKSYGGTTYGFYVNLYDSLAFDGNNRFYLRPQGTNLTGGRIINGVFTSVPVIVGANDALDWHMYTITTSGTLLKFYRDGVLLGNATAATTSPSAFPVLELSGDTVGYSAVFDEVRVENVAVSDTIIQAWYQSRKSNNYLNYTGVGM
jgi:hypothetical protein